MANVFELEGSISMDTSDFDKAVKEAKKGGTDLAKALEQAAAQMKSMQSQIDRLENELSSTKSEISRMKAELDKAGKATEDAADSTSELAEEADKTADSISDETKAVERNADSNADLSDVINKISKTMDSLVDVVKELGKREEDTTEQTDEYTDSAGEAKEETGKLEKGMHSLGDTTKSVGGHIGDLAGKIKDTLVTAAKVGAAAVGAASTAIAALTKSAVSSFGEYEQLKGGAQKIFDNMDYSIIAKDAANAYKDLNMSASQYLESINLAGAAFAQTMGDEKGYNTARKGMIAIADYASGTGKNLSELNQKYQMITRATSSYQSIADQFSRILPATSADFLEQAQAAGLLSKEYTKLTEVPVAEYQQAVTEMLDKGVTALGLSNNTAREATETLTGSMAMTKAAWENLVTGLADPDADLGTLISNFTESAEASLKNIIPTVERALSGIGELVTELSPVIVEKLPELISTILPGLISSGTKLVKAIGEALIKTAPLLAPMVKDLLIKTVNTVTQNAPMVIKTISSLIKKFSELFKANAPQFIQMGVNMILSIVDGITENLPVILEAALTILETLGKAIVDNAPMIIDSVITFIETFGKFLTDNLPELIPAAIAMIIQLADALTQPDNIKRLVDTAVDVVLALVDGILAALPQILEAAPKIIENIVEGITDEETLNKLIDGVIEAVGKIAEWLMNPENLADIVSAAGQIIWAFIKGMFKIRETLLGKVGGLLGEIGDTVKGYFTTAFNWGKDLILKFIDGIKSMAGEIKDAISDIIPDDVKDLFSGAKKKVASILPFAEGGITAHAVGGTMINSPVLTTSGDLFGEAGREIILPLDRNTEWMDRIADRVNTNKGGDIAPMIIQEVNINFPEGLTIGSDYDTDRMIERISEQLSNLQMAQTAAVGGANW